MENNKAPLSLQECKDQVARNNGWNDWKTYDTVSVRGEKYLESLDKAAELHAKQFQKSEPLSLSKYCECNFVMIMRGENDVPYCATCQKEVDERPVSKIEEESQEELTLLIFHKWMLVQGWTLHSSGDYYYRLKYSGQWPPEETCLEFQLLEKFKKH